MPQLKKNRL